MRRFIFALAVTLSPTVVFAECDFGKPLGLCRATISIDSTSGSKGSYSAEVSVRSSAPSCSKVEYFLDNTPQTTVIKNGSSEDESLFGTKPITKKALQIKKCIQYALKGSEVKPSDGAADNAASGARFFQGRWIGSIGWGIARGSVTLDISVNGNHGSGSSQSSVGGPQRIDGTISGNRMTYQHVDEDETVTVVLTRVSSTILSYDASSAQGGMIHVTGKLTRQ